MRPATGRAGASDAFTVNIRQTLQEIDGADTVEELQSHRAQPPQSLALATVVMHYLFAAVVVTKHVIGEDNVTLLGEVDTTRRNRTACNVLKAAATPMPVRTYNAGERPRCAFRTVEIACREEAGEGFKMNLFHRVIFACHFPKDIDVQGSRFRCRHQSCRDANLLA